ncbi:lipopolysaccharide assembly protein LapA domain-containing protein [Qaidamihabitans albus]|uniref:lipopolysaccharide assembly protein LapA domain-containing protein n=1 Tax=Qaidamihabitans albus TaxID=2795733 RepID=UPI0027DCC354|nr:lipopolysaccharide assembly protein LapA domain-containing protein [Qaidamihabitans albus]
MSTSSDDNSPVPSRAEGESPAETAEQDRATEQDRNRDVMTRTRLSGIWASAIIGALLLVFLLVFILQNTASVTVRFLGFSGAVPLGVALLFAAVGAALLVALLGVARILQLRRRVRRSSQAQPRS